LIQAAWAGHDRSGQDKHDLGGAMYRLIAVAATAIALAFSSNASAFVDKDCSDFASWRAAQHYYKKHGGPRHDPARLDADHDGIACEDLR